MTTKKAWRDNMKDHEDELDLLLTRIADILGKAGEQDPINSFDIRSPDFHPIRLTWTREGRRVHARMPPTPEGM